MDPRSQHIRPSPRLASLITHFEKAIVSLPDDHPFSITLKRLQRCWQGASSLKSIDRFLDRAQKVILENPLPDGSNIATSAPDPRQAYGLQLEDEFRRLLIRMLHRKGLTFVDADGNYDMHYLLAFGYLYAAARALLMDEFLSSHPYEATDGYALRRTDEDVANAKWLFDSRQRILNLMERVAASVSQRLDLRTPGQLARDVASKNQARVLQGLPPFANVDEELMDHFANTPVLSLEAQVDANLQALGMDYLNNIMAVCSPFQPYVLMKFEAT